MSQRRLARSHEWFVVLASALLSVSCSNDLSRSKAKSLLEADPTIALPTTLRFVEGRKSAPDVFEGPYGALMHQGLATASPDSSDPAGGTYTFALTSEGKSQASQWHRDESGITLPVARKVVGEITGIVQGAGVDADGEFSWHWEATFPHIQVASDILTGKARFRRYDDGWRLQQAVLEHSPTNQAATNDAPPPIKDEQALSLLRKEISYVRERYHIPIGIECIPRDSDQNFFAGGAAALQSGKSSIVEIGKARWNEFVSLRAAGLITLKNLGQQRRPNILFPNVETKCPDSDFDAEAIEISLAPGRDTDGWTKVSDGWWADRHTGFEITSVNSIQRLNAEGTVVAVTYQWRYTGITDAGRAAGTTPALRTATWRLVKYRDQWGAVAYSVPR